MLGMLFKRTSTGAIQTWEIELEHGTGRFRTISGQIEGKKTASKWTQCVAKNVGRSNATTPDQQAVIEANNKWEEKQRDGYFQTIDGAKASTRFEPMLAAKWSEDRRREETLKAAAADRLDSQPKLDGVRCIASRHSLMSREFRPFVAVPHIREALDIFHARFPLVVLDGELYNHDLREDFNQIISLVRASKPTPEDLAKSAESAEQVEYWIYDVAGPGLEEQSYRKRFGGITEVLRGMFGPMSPIRIVPTTRVRNQEEIDAAYAMYLGDKYEGQMLRHDAPYEQDKRSKYLIKRKEHDDEEFTIVNIHEGVGNRSGEAGYVALHDSKNDVRFNAGIKGDQVFREKLLKERERYVGGKVTIRFNGRTPDRVPRFPRALEDKWWPEGRDM